MRVYVASSWRCVYQPEIVALLRAEGHEVYDFRNPRPGDRGFAWSEIDPDWQEWIPGIYRDALQHPIAKASFASDFDAMQWADACVLVLPCGRSAHLEAGWFVGAGKRLVILLDKSVEPELIYKMADVICLTPQEVISVLASKEAPDGD